MVSDGCDHRAQEAGGAPRAPRAGTRALPRDLVDPLEGMARLRNRIAHGYASVEVERLWQELPDGLAVLDRFVVAIARLVEQT